MNANGKLLVTEIQRFCMDLGARIRLKCILVNNISSYESHYEKLADIALSIRNFDGLELMPYHAKETVAYVKEFLKDKGVNVL